MLAANAVTFLVSAAVLRTIRIDPEGSLEQEPTPEDEPAASLWASTVEGARSARQIPGVPMLLTISAISILAGALMNVAEPLTSRVTSMRGGSDLTPTASRADR